MFEHLFTLLINAAAIYAGCGLLVALVFLTRWRKAFDLSAADGSWGFCLLIVPGLVALWPVILAKVWIVARGGTAQGSAETPVGQETLRRSHRFAFFVLAVVGPLLFVVALFLRAPQLEDAPPVDVTATLNTR